MTTSLRRTAKAGGSKQATTRTGAAPDDDASLLTAAQSLLEPLVQLLVARGMPFATVEELLKRVFVHAARRVSTTTATPRRVSRISTVTGLHRREVSRLLRARGPAMPTRRSPATQVFTRWVAEPSLKDASGRPIPLPRRGPAPSFEELARSVTQDVHPRSLLDELCRLGLARVEGEMVHIVRERFVPKSDSDRMLDFLASNVGDHLRAAVGNVLSDAPEHLEQAVFADELSPASVAEFRQSMRSQWQALLTASVPLLHRLIEDDRAARRPQDRRVRIGMYMFSDAMTAPTGAAVADAIGATP